MPTLREQDCLVEAFPDVVWIAYIMKITHLPTGLRVQEAVMETPETCEAMPPLREKLLERLAKLVNEQQGQLKCQP